MRTSAPNPNHFPDPSLSLPQGRIYFFSSPCTFYLSSPPRAIQRSPELATAQIGWEGSHTSKNGIGEESLDVAFSRDRNRQRWQCRFPPRAWLSDRAWPGVRRAGGHVRGDPRTLVSGRRCPLPGGAVGAAVRQPDGCARALAWAPRGPAALGGSRS